MNNLQGPENILPVLNTLLSALRGANGSFPHVIRYLNMLHFGSIRARRWKLWVETSGKAEFQELRQG